MASTITERQKINTLSAVKVPCKAATTANITLSGEQTIDGVACVTNDRVLVKNQTTASENGIYVVNTSGWERARDWDGSYDVKKGTFVYVTNGGNSGFWYVTTDDPIVPGTTSVAISQASSQLVTFSAFAQTLLDDADAAAFLTTLGFSAFIQTLLDDANAATARGTLGAAADSEVVHNTGDETVAGNKTLSGTLTMSSKPINEAKGSDITAAATTDIGAATGNYVDITHASGTVAISALGTVQAGTRRHVRFVVSGGTLTLTYNATSLILPGAADITVANGDRAVFVSLGSGNWDCHSYTRSSVRGVTWNSQVFTSSGTFTVPIDTSEVIVTLVGGGGGGGSGGDTGASSGNNGAGGTTSVFSTLQAAGGSGGQAGLDGGGGGAGGAGGATPTASSLGLRSAGVTGSSKGALGAGGNGASLGLTYYSRAGSGGAGNAAGLASTAGAGVIYGGGGGGGGGNDGSDAGGGGGGSGAIIYRQNLGVTPGSSITVTVGTGGAGGARTTGLTSNGGAGADGAVIVEWAD